MYNGFINFKKEMIFLKVFIWVSCYLFLAFFQTAARESGIIIGAIPLILLYSLLFWIAKKLCNYWDERQAEKSASIASDAPVPEEPPAPDPEPAPTIADPSSPAPATPKLRYCKLCGAPIDPTTRKCTDCRKQYFRPPVLHKKHLAIAGAALACAAVVFLVFNLVSSLVSQKDAAQAQVDDLNARITELESTVAEKERQIEVYKRNEDAYQVKLTRKSEEYDKLREENTMYKDLLDFYEEYVAFIGDSESMDYHKFPCPYMDAGEGIYVYSISLLEEYGYEPCPYCGG